jgi:hypothetical protein
MEPAVKTEGVLVYHDWQSLAVVCGKMVCKCT